MDNILDFLIVLFFIISLLASLAKKKNKPGTTTTSYRKQPEPEEDYFEVPDIFSDTTSQGTDYYQEETSGYNDTAPAQTEEEAKILLEELEYKAPTKKEAQSVSEFYDIHSKSKGEYADYSKLKSLREILRNPITVREYYLISEILAKPKALRR